MTVRAPSRGRLLGVALAVLVLLPSVGAQGVSVPPPSYPALPDPTSVVVFVPDLDAAPPVAQGPIVQLVQLGAYPLTAEMEALPNHPLDAETAAYMLVNLFVPGDGEQFPMPADAALAALAATIGTDLPSERVLTVADLREAMLDLLNLPPEGEAALRAVLDERYPALRAGNPDAPLTRAGAALLLAMTVDHLNAPAG